VRGKLLAELFEGFPRRTVTDIRNEIGDLCVLRHQFPDEWGQFGHCAERWEQVTLLDEEVLQNLSVVMIEKARRLTGDVLRACIGGQLALDKDAEPEAALMAVRKRE